MLTFMAKKSSKIVKAKAAPKKRDREATQSKLLKAGLEIFSKFGYDAATTQMVAKKAGVNEALISRYFKGKSGLLTALLIGFIQESESSKVNGYPAGQTIEEEIRNFLTFAFEHDLKYRDFLRVAIHRGAVDAKLRKDAQKHLSMEGHPYIAQRLEGFRKKGMIAPDLDLMELTQVILNHSIGFMFTTCFISSVKVEDIYKIIEVSAKNLAQGIQIR